LIDHDPENEPVDNVANAVPTVPAVPAVNVVLFMLMVTILGGGAAGARAIAVASIAVPNPGSVTLLHVVPVMSLVVLCLVKLVILLPKYQNQIFHVLPIFSSDGLS
jgi:hypothetical protein